MNAEHFLSDVVSRFQELKKLGDGAIAQVPEFQRFTRLDEESNSIATMVKHVAGNLRSRWTDFLTTDGEKPDRNRDGEFESSGSEDFEALLKNWEEGWEILFGVLAKLRTDQLDDTVFIRAQPHSVVQAINRQLSHYAYHVGQIVFLAKHFAGGSWRTLSLPRKRSASAHNE